MTPAQKWYAYFETHFHKWERYTLHRFGLSLLDFAMQRYNFLKPHVYHPVAPVERRYGFREMFCEVSLFLLSQGHIETLQDVFSLTTIGETSAGRA